jgi:uncharacterized protein
VAHFLSALLDQPSERFQLIDATTGVVVAGVLKTAFDSASRRTGLLQHAGLAPDTAMIIAPCNAIHTFFMKFPIDVVFVRKNGTVLKVKRSIPAWRLTASVGAFAAIEMGAGQVGTSVVAGTPLIVALRK